MIELKEMLLKSIVNNDVIMDRLMGYKDEQPRVCYYHMVTNHERMPIHYHGNLFTVDSLEQQIQWLINKRYKFITLDEALYLAMNDEKAKKTIAFTTDDGFKENFTIIGPLFNKYKIKATLFLVANTVDNHNMMWRNKLIYIEKTTSMKKRIDLCREMLKAFGLNIKSIPGSLLEFSHWWPQNQKDVLADYAWESTVPYSVQSYLAEQQPYMTSEQIKTLIEDGYAIGSHSLTHPDFSKLSEAEILNEMTISKTVLQGLFKTEIYYFSYPFGKRPNLELENRIIATNIFRYFFGTKSNLSNIKANRVWERDKLEKALMSSKLYFALIPPVRSLFRHRLGRYR